MLRCQHSATVPQRHGARWRGRYRRAGASSPIIKVPPALRRGARRGKTVLPACRALLPAMEQAVWRPHSGAYLEGAASRQTSAQSSSSLMEVLIMLQGFEKRSMGRRARCRPRGRHEKPPTGGGTTAVHLRKASPCNLPTTSLSPPPYALASNTRLLVQKLAAPGCCLHSARSRSGITSLARPALNPHLAVHTTRCRSGGLRQCCRCWCWCCWPRLLRGPAPLSRLRSSRCVIRGA